MKDGVIMIANLDELKQLIRSLTYGEMMELVEGLWSGHASDNGLTKDAIAPAIHRWAVSMIVVPPEPIAEPHAYAAATENISTGAFTFPK
jgi:hypothetical protein